MQKTQKITPCLWFDAQAEEAAKFYTSVFDNSRIVNTVRYGEAGYEIHKRPPGMVMTVEFELSGQTFTALNGGPMFKFNEAVSLQIMCDTQREVDYYWEKLSQACKDRAAGSPTSSASHGRSFPPSCPRCSLTPIQRRRKGS